jgi:hypothetical protein
MSDAQRAPSAGIKVPPIFTQRAEPHCHHCGFALQGLPSAGNCPECGTAYDPLNSYRLHHAPSAYQSIAYLARPLYYGAVATVLACGFFPPLFVVAVPAAIAWTGWRVHVYREVMRTHVLPPGMAVAPGVRPLGLAASLVARLLLGVGVLLTIGGVWLAAACVLFRW